MLILAKPEDVNGESDIDFWKDVLETDEPMGLFAIAGAAADTIISKPVIKKAKLRMKGGPGSGHFGHAGRPGLVGGSQDENTAISMSASEGYVEDLQKYCHARQIRRNQELRGNVTFSKADADEGMFGLGFRGVSAETYAQAEYVEKASDRETMLEVMGAQSAWNLSPVSAKLEWSAAKALGGDDVVLPKDVEIIQLSDKQIAAYRARQEFAQEYVRQTYGEEITLWRGIYGKQAINIDKERVAYQEKYPGDYEGANTVKLGLRALSSFTNNSYEAQGFADFWGKSKRKGGVFEARISYKDIWAVDDLGVKSPIRFANDHGEFVIHSKKDYTGAKLVKWTGNW